MFQSVNKRFNLMTGILSKTKELKWVKSMAEKCNISPFDGIE